MRNIVGWLAVAAIASVLAAPCALAQPAQGVAMHGDPAYPPDFTHFSYVDPSATKGGSLVMAAIGSFDSTNPYIIRGEPVMGIGLVYDTLTVQSNDEAFTEYGLLAEKIDMPEDRSWVAFELRPQARWQDGTPVTVD